MGPFKCPECGVWWVGLEHRCNVRTSSNSPNIGWGHCHGCLSFQCRAADHEPCLMHQSGWTTSGTVSAT